MDGLLTLPSPRASGEAKASYAHKLSARARHHGSTGLSPRPPPPRSSPRHYAGSYATTPRGRASACLTVESFRSVAVLEAIVRAESVHARPSMGPEEAFRLLQRLVASASDREDALHGLSHQQLLDGLEAACWRSFSPCSPRHQRPGCASSRRDSNSSGRTIAVSYAQLYSGITESIREKEAAIAALETALREASAHTNELPRRIHAREREIARTIASFVALSAASLDCAAPRDRTDFGKHAVLSTTRGGGDDRLAAAVRDRIATLRRRRDLRAWACDQLRAATTELLTRASELKKEITVVLGEVKKEELALKVKTRRMEEAMLGMAVSPTGRKNSISGVVATRMMAAGGLAAVAATANLAGAAAGAQTPALHERLTLAHERRRDLQEEIARRQEQVRRHTEEIFDVRNEVQTLAAAKRDVELETEALHVEMSHIQRACTPRPDWEELQRAVLVTTAVDHLKNVARVSLQSRERRGHRDEPDEDDEEYTARRLKTILTSAWTTVDKVEALAHELSRIRTRYHGGEELAGERAKLEQLQCEIQKTVAQLSTVRSLASRGAAPSRSGGGATGGSGGAGGESHATGAGEST